jgi:hypothetical protein
MKRLSCRQCQSARLVGFASLLVSSAFALTSERCQAAIEPRSILKSYFETGDVPTQQQFADMIDSSLNLTDDGLTAYLVCDSSDRAALFSAGATVGPGLAYSEFSTVPGFSDAWLGQSGFLALSFLDGPQLHYGYLQISSGAPGSTNPYSMVTEYFVFENLANTPLVTSEVPEPSSLVLAGVGALALFGSATLRRSKR